MTHQVKVGRCGGKVSFRVREPGFAFPAPPLVSQLTLHIHSDAQFPYYQVTTIILTSQVNEKIRLYMKITYIVAGT